MQDKFCRRCGNTGEYRDAVLMRKNFCFCERGTSLKQITEDKEKKIEIRSKNGVILRRAKEEQVSA